MGSVSVSSCRCCMFVSCVYPVAVLNAEFYMTCSLLPILFIMYIDKRVVMLRISGIWCHIGSVYIGALSCTDAIIVLCPSTRGLNEHIVLCCEYAQ